MPASSAASDKAVRAGRLCACASAVGRCAITSRTARSARGRVMALARTFQSDSRAWASASRAASRVTFGGLVKHSTGSIQASSAWPCGGCQVSFCGLSPLRSQTVAEALTSLPVPAVLGQHSRAWRSQSPFIACPWPRQTRRMSVCVIGCWGRQRSTLAMSRVVPPPMARSRVCEACASTRHRGFAKSSKAVVSHSP